MEMKKVGEVRVIDFSDLVRSVANSLRKENERFEDNRAYLKMRNQVEELVWSMMDDWITEQMYWTKAAGIYNENKYCKLLREICKVPGAGDIIEMLSDAISSLLLDVIELPTWNILHARHYNSMVHLELGVDYRIQDWMSKFAGEYGQPENTHDW